MVLYSYIRNSYFFLYCKIFTLHVSSEADVCVFHVSVFANRNKYQKNNGLSELQPPCLFGNMET